MSDGEEPEREPMPDKLRPLAEAAIKRHQRRRIAPQIVTVPEQRYFEHLTCPYRAEDEDLWCALVLECFGTRVAEVGQAFFRQLSSLCPEVLYEGETYHRRDETAMRQALAMVYDLKPRNTIEAAGAAQMVALHFATMNVGRSIANRQYVDPRTAATLAALAKAYSSQLRALQDGRGRKSTRQIIKVEKHVHLHNEKHIHMPGEGGGNSGSQAHEPTRERARARAAGGPPERPALPRPDEGGNLVPLPRDPGPLPLPAARLRQGIGGAEG